MANVEFVLNEAGVAELMKSAEMQSVLKEFADQVQQRAGDGYETNTYVGTNRANVSVSPATKEAWKDNMDHNTLLKALGV